MRRFIVTSLTLIAGIIAPLSGQDQPLGMVRGDFDAEVRRRCDLGLAWLASHQNSNGSWTNKVGYKLYEDYWGEEGDSVDVTALASMAFVSAGNVPGRGKYGKTVERAVDFLLSCVREDGYITRSGSRMYSHAFATLFLAEIHGMTRRNDVKDKLKMAVNLIVNAQNKEGGWRYSPSPIDADLSVTVSTLQALRAARNVGVAVPMDTIERAARYVKYCARRNGGFQYQTPSSYGMGNDERVSFALTACGIVSLYSSGEYDSKEIRDSLRQLPMLRRNSNFMVGKLHYYYGHYYASQAMYLAGGDYWGTYYPSVKREILDHQILDRQMENGSWTDDVGQAYATAMAIIILQMPCELLPIFQK